MLEILIVGVVVLLFAEVYVLNQLIKVHADLSGYAAAAKQYVEAYEHVQEAVNRNSNVFASWFELIQKFSIDIELLKIRSDLYAEALSIKPFVMPEIPAPEPEIL